jgi:hypothetical protein
MADARTDRVWPKTGARVLLKILVSVVVGAVAWVVTQRLLPEQGTDYGATTTVGFGVSIFLGGVVFVVQFLIEVEHRLLGLPTVLRKEVKEVSAAAEVYGIIEASDFKTDRILELVRNATSIPMTDQPLIFNFAQAEIARLSKYLHDLGQKTDLVYDGEDRDWLLGLTKVARQSIDATSLTTIDTGGKGSVDPGLWGSELGHRYLDAQRRAITQGEVVIRRIFILDRPELKEDPKFLSVLREHHLAGVRVKTIDPQAAPATIHPLLIDFIVIDGVLVYHSEHVGGMASAEHAWINTTRLVTAPDRVARDRDRYELLWNAAEEFPRRSGPDAHHTQSPLNEGVANTVDG